MADETTKVTTNPPNVSETTKTAGDSQTSPIDFKNLTEDQLAQVYENPNLYKHTRFKQLTEKAKKADEFEQKQQELERQSLEKKGEYEKLSEQYKSENTSLKEQIKNAKIDSAIERAASKLGAVDPNVVMKLIDKNGIVLDQDGNITGADEAVKTLLDASPYLKGKAAPTVIGNPSNPGDSEQSIKRFKASQIQDPVFYRAHEKDIDAAMRSGLIEDDIGQNI